MKAAGEGNLDALKMLLEHKADVNQPSNSGATPLHMAAHKGLSDIAALLLEASAEVHARGNDGRTPLFDACLDNRLETARLLLRRGVDASLATTHPQTGAQATPRLIAEHYGHTKVVKLLDAVRGHTPLHFACEERNPTRLRDALRRDDTDVFARTPSFGKKSYSASCAPPLLPFLLPTSC